MRILIILALIMVPACSNLRADAASMDSKISEFLTLIGASALQEQINTQLGDQIDRAVQNLAQQAGIPAAEQRAATADIQTKMMSAMHDAMSWEKLKAGMMESYRATYTEADMDGILAFFKSPVGQIYLTKSPTISAKTRDQTEAKVKELGNMFQTMGRQWMDQHAKPSAAPAPK